MGAPTSSFADPSLRLAVRPTLPQLLTQAERLLPVYLQRTAHLGKQEKGIRRSELFFFFALVEPFRPRRILESGRARAQSTLVLSALFPDAKIISIESDKDSPDVPIAAERLRERSNVTCLFGNSRQLLPEMVQPDDIVLVDGPKDFRGLKLALELLANGKPAAVFLHDLWPRSPGRPFVDRWLQSAYLSDDPEWVRRYSSLDAKRSQPPLLPAGRRYAYGATLACFPRGAERYRWKLLLCAAAQGWERLRTTARKLGSGTERTRPRDFEIVTRGSR